MIISESVKKDLSDKEKENENVNFGELSSDNVITFTFIQKLIILIEKIFLNILWFNNIVGGDNWGHMHVHALELFSFYGWIWIFYNFTINLIYVHIGIYLSFTDFL